MDRAVVAQLDTHRPVIRTESEHTHTAPEAAQVYAIVAGHAAMHVNRQSPCPQMVRGCGSGKAPGPCLGGNGDGWILLRQEVDAVQDLIDPGRLA
jgi:hypothetical protein